MLKLLLVGSFGLLAVNARATLPAQWDSRGPGGGGSLFAPSFSPYNSGECFIACDLSAQFHTTTGGAAWGLVDFRQTQGNRNAVVQFTSSPLILYSLDYTSLGGGDTRRPTRSTDGGITWTPLPNDPTGQDAYSLFADINSTNRLVVSDYNNVYFSSNGGTTFSQIFSNPADGCLVGGAFFDGSNIFVDTGTGLLVSTNNGSTFAVASLGGIPSSQGVFSFVGAKQGGITRFFAGALGTGSIYPGVQIEGEFSNFGGIYTLDWGQPNWVLHTNGIPVGNDTVFAGMTLTNIWTAYAAGQDPSGNPAVFKTTNGGTNWTSVLITANNQNIFTGWSGQGGDRGWGYGAGALGFAVAPYDANTAAWTDMGFCHITTNGGAFWLQSYVNRADQNPTNAPTPTGRFYHGIGLENTSCWDMTWGTSNQIFAGYTDIIGALSTNAGSSWSFGYTGDGENTMYRCLRHPVSGVLYAATSSIHDLYQSTRLEDSPIDSGNGLILYSTNNGTAWQTLYNPGMVTVWVQNDPTNPNRLYASLVHSNSGGIYVSTNIQNGGTSTWTKMPAPPRTDGHAFNIRVLNDGTVVCSFCARRNAAGAFTNTSGVFLCTNPVPASTAVWLDRSDPSMQYWTKDVIINPYDASQSNWYACVFNGFGGPPNNKGGLYRTFNRGQTWTKIADNTLPPSGLLNVESCGFSPVNSNEFVFSTELDGLWASTNINAVTPAFFSVTNYPYSHPLRFIVNPYNSNEVWLTSFGNGLRVGTVSGSTTVSSPTPYQAWQAIYFGANTNNPAIAGDFADPDGDGIPNLLEYALGLDPIVNSRAGLPVVGTQTTGGSNYLTLTFNRVVANTDLTYTVQVSGNVTNWLNGSSYSATTIIATNANTTELSRAGTTIQSIVVRDNIPINAAASRFIRLQVTGP